MNGDKNKPLDSSQLHQGTNIEVSVRSKADSIEHEPTTSSDSEESTVNINVKNHSAGLSPEPVSPDQTQASQIEPSHSQANYQPENDIAEDLKVQENLQPEVPAVAELEPDSKPEAPVEPVSSSNLKSNQESLNSQPSPKEKSANTPGILVLQWLTYAFWGWTGLTTIWLIYIVSTHFIGGSQSPANDSAYIFAAAVVLLPLSIICDWFFSRKEADKKTGVSMILMILHAVLLALIAIGTLIIFMYALVQYMLVSPSDLTGVYIMMATSISAAAISSIIFLRVLNPLPKMKLGLLLSIVMFITIAVLAVITLTGPIKTQKAIQQDNQTSEQLTMLVTSLDEHAKKHNDLPANLSSSSFKGKDNPLVVNNEVEYTKYKQNNEVASISPDDDLPEFKDHNRIEDDAKASKIAFQLCVNYRVDTSYEFTQPLSVAQPSDSFFVTDDHKAGKNCYELYAVVSASH